MPPWAKRRAHHFHDRTPRLSCEQDASSKFTEHFPSVRRTQILHAYLYTLPYDPSITPRSSNNQRILHITATVIVTHPSREPRSRPATAPTVAQRIRRLRSNTVLGRFPPAGILQIPPPTLNTAIVASVISSAIHELSQTGNTHRGSANSTHAAILGAHVNAAMSPTSWKCRSSPCRRTHTCQPRLLLIGALSRKERYGTNVCERVLYFSGAN